MLKHGRLFVGLFLLLLGGWLAVDHYMPPRSKPIPRADLFQLVDRNLVTKTKLQPTSFPGIFEIQGIRKDQNRKFSVTTHLDEKQIQRLLVANDVELDLPGAGGKGGWVNIASTVVIGGLILGLVYYQTNVGRNKKNHRVKERPTTRFADVAGINEAKAEVSEVVDFLKNSKKYKRVGGKLPKGILLVGPPGTGKTLLARAIAGEAQANFFSAHGSDFNEVYVGVGAKRVRELFRLAIRNQPAIIFIDEIDCLAKSRKHDTNGETQQTNNALLACMDGFEGSEGVVILAATNRPEDLDEALMRPGRFDRKVHVPYPDVNGRREILEAHSRSKPIHEKHAALHKLAQTTPGMSGADLANLLNEAAILCAQRNRMEITLSDLEDSRDKVRFGNERKTLVLKPSEREWVAYHEAGHTIINLLCPDLPQLYKVSIVPRGSALGVTTLLPLEDQHIHNKDFLLQELLVLMGGRAAEKVFYGCTSNGANGDLDSAKKIAHNMIHAWGMGERLYYEPKEDQAEVEINRLLEEADQKAHSIILEHREQTEQLAKKLLEKETLTKAEVLSLVSVGCAAV